MQPATTTYPALSFASAYRQLSPSEKAYTDGYVATVEREAMRRNERISNALYRPISAAVVEEARGMLGRPMVRAAITERINELAAASELTVQRVVKELMAISFSSLADYMTVGEDGIPTFDLARCTPEQLSAIKSIELENGRGGAKIKIVLHDKLAGIDKLATYMGMLKADNPHWRLESVRPAMQQITAATSNDAAADLWASMIDG